MGVDDGIYIRPIPVDSGVEVLFRSGLERTLIGQGFQVHLYDILRSQSPVVHPGWGAQHPFIVQPKGKVSPGALDQSGIQQSDTVFHHLLPALLFFR